MSLSYNIAAGDEIPPLDQQPLIDRDGVAVVSVVSIQESEVGASINEHGTGSGGRRWLMESCGAQGSLLLGTYGCSRKCRPLQSEQFLSAW